MNLACARTDKLELCSGAEFKVETEILPSDGSKGLAVTHPAFAIVIFFAILAI